MYKIRVLTFCFRDLPNYFPLWLKSAGCNSDIDFLVVTQDQTEYDLPKNVVIQHAFFKDILSDVQKKFDFPLQMTDPYKFCDMRPAFGYLFPQWFEGYDFWGGCDLDVIFGDLRKFVTDEVLDKYDKILTRDHFYLYRNTDEVNRRFMLPVHGMDAFYKTVFSDPKLHCFGERSPHGMFCLYNQHGFSMWDKDVVADIHDGYKRFIVWSDSDKSKKQLFEWKDGALLRHEVKKNRLESEEFAYIHLQRRPMTIDMTDLDNGFLIVPNRFIAKPKGEMNPAIVMAYQPRCPVYWYVWKRRGIKLLSMIRNRLSRSK